ncbi:MAG TPA: biotin synthase BioB [Alphaproteobacteria bacterium]|nr:biotin synthase BioB [Alphaproteobacteria bacterium]
MTAQIEAFPSKKPSRAEVAALYGRPLLDLIFQAAQVHRAHHNPREIQMCRLLSIKTGGCPEDCKYCSQSVHNGTELKKEPLMQVDAILEQARAAKEGGATRFCMGAAWREVKDGRAFERVLEAVRGVRALGLEACVTLGMLNDDQAVRLKEAGLTAYNHNLDTSEKHYANIVSTHTYQDRLRTLQSVSKAGISACCGGIMGMGETDEDRIDFLHTLAGLDPQPESVPINALVPVSGTPLEAASALNVFAWLRVIAVARILMPKAMVRLSAGRLALSQEAQALAFLAGANAIFTGDKLLTTPNPEADVDGNLMQALSLVPRPPDKEEPARAHA